jgi:EmrB/QacA subfamily drug resistance transporter
MAFVDGTVVNVALPTLQRELGATVAGAQWVVESYALLLASLLLVGGALGDRFGRRRVFSAGIALFAGASILCGASMDIGLLIAARAVQGIGGALLVPGSLAIISNAFSKAERGRAIGLWSGFSAISGGAGLLLGGWLLDTTSWRAIFFINVPVAAVTLAITFRHVRESRDDSAPPTLDWPGAALATLALGGLTLGLIESSVRGWTAPLVIGALIVGILALAAFIGVEKRSRAPMVPLAMFRSATFSGANLMTLLVYAALGGMMFFVPLNLIQVQGYSAAAAGAANLPFILLMFFLSRWSGGLIERYGARLPLIVGPLITTAGLALFMLPGVGGSYWTTFFPPIVIVGAGMAVTVAPLTTVVMAAAEAHRAGLASGINNAVSRAASVLAIAVLGPIMVGVFSASLDARLDKLDVAPDIRAALHAQRVNLGAARVPAQAEPAQRAALAGVIDRAFVDGFRVVAVITACLTLLGSICSATLIGGRRPARRHAESLPRPT